MDTGFKGKGGMPVCSAMCMRSAGWLRSCTHWWHRQRASIEVSVAASAAGALRRRAVPGCIRGCVLPRAL
jgi:hypothetical protein